MVELAGITNTTAPIFPQIKIGTINLSYTQ